MAKGLDIGNRYSANTVASRISRVTDSPAVKPRSAPVGPNPGPKMAVRIKALAMPSAKDRLTRA